MKNMPSLYGENGDRLTINETGLDGDDEVDNVSDVEKVIAKWIEANPQAILQSVSNMQKKKMEERMKDAQTNISASQDKLFDKNSAQFSRSGYDVTIVEFFDYNCGYCKKAQATIEQLLKEDKRIRIIYKDFPILGNSSAELAKVSVAVNLLKPSAYRDFHNALMTSSARDQNAAIQVAKSVGIDATALAKTIKEQEAKINEILQANIALCSSIGINGTPGFVIGEELIPGALDIQAFRERIASSRSK